MLPLISVIVPVYKVEQYLDKCVQSLLSQTYKNLEIILVDDGSPDDCGKLCDKYAKHDSRINVIHKDNGGLSDARNIALDVARGEYIGFVDSDDWIDESMYETLINTAIKEKADIVECKFINAYDRSFVNNEKSIENIKTFSNISAIEDHLYGRNLYRCVWNKIYKADLFSNIRFPRGLTAEDLHTTYKLFYKANKIAHVDYVGYYYYIRRDSIMGKAGLPLIMSTFEGMKEQHEFINEKMPNFKARIDELYMNCLLKTASYLDANTIPNESMKYKEIVASEIKRKDILTSGITKGLVSLYNIWPSLAAKGINLINSRKR